MITVPHLEVRASRPGPAAPGASPALTPSRPDAVPLRSDRRPGLPLRTGLPGEDPAVPAQSRVPLRRKRPAGTQGGGDIDEPSVVTEGSRSIGNHAASEIDAPGPRLTPTCGGRTRRPRTEEWPLPDPHPRSQRQLGALDPRSPITEGFRPFSVAEHSPLTRGTGPGSLSEARLSPRLLTRPKWFTPGILPSHQLFSIVAPEPGFAFIVGWARSCIKQRPYGSSRRSGGNFQPIRHSRP
jgi:hypothetical protein